MLCDQADGANIRTPMYANGTNCFILPPLPDAGFDRTNYGTTKPQLDGIVTAPRNPQRLLPGELISAKSPQLAPPVARLGRLRSTPIVVPPLDQRSLQSDCHAASAACG